MAYLAGKHASSQVKTFLAAHKRTRDVQQRLLRQLLAAHGETDFGRDHGFAHVKGHKDFKSAVPIGSYETLRPYMRRVLDGQTTALLPPGEKPLMFSMTSGTTGKPKYIPVTQRFLADMQRGWNIFGLKTLQDHKAGWLRGILQISSPMSEKTSPTGLPCGAISGLLAQTQKKIVRRMYVVPRGVYSIADPAAKYYTILRCGVGRDVAIITTANPSSTIKLIETGQLHAERLIRDVADGSLTPPGEFAAPLPAKLRFKPNRAMAQRLEKGLAKDGRLLPRHFWNIAFLT
ncbi:MAG: GH3 auxin-responsive promoter family protein, partial [Phycisphaerae bacterium]|nr:GH3 auxin-responsive promoter family protein [Phycisphaerae bacterium]